MILTKIVEQTKSTLASRKRLVSMHVLIEQAEDQVPARDFSAALRRPDTVNIIAEAKKASPSKGIIRADFDPVSIARCYEQNGAGAISVLTEEHFFQGHLDYLKNIRSAVSIPLLRKDFIIDPYQIYEARAAGADALLLIAAVLEQHELDALYQLTRDLGMHALIEVHTKEELKNAIRVKPAIIGINNRDLNTFITDIQTSVQMRPLIPENIITVSESGINTPDDICCLRSSGIDAFLIGESLMREHDPAQKLIQLLNA
jgi:indole-3-glycerol phosphate synthase